MRVTAAEKVYSIAKIKTSMPISQTSDSINPNEKDLCSTKKKTVTNVSKKEATRFLPFKRIMTDSKGYQKTSYRSSEKDCGKCPLRAKCCGKITKFKKIEDSLHKPLYDQMHGVCKINCVR